MYQKLIDLRALNIIKNSIFDFKKLIKLKTTYNLKKFNNPRKKKMILLSSRIFSQLFSNFYSKNSLLTQTAQWS